jgi:hypothetical protein
MTDRACIACGKNSPHLFRFKVNGCKIWQCERCGLGRAEASSFDPKSYYTADYFSGSRADGYSDYLGAEPVLRREFTRSVDFVRRFIRSGRVLDLGAPTDFSSRKPGVTSRYSESNWPSTQPRLAEKRD